MNGAPAFPAAAPCPSLFGRERSTNRKPPHALKDAIGWRLQRVQAAGRHLLESPLSEDQNVQFTPTGYTITATVQQTLLLDRWLGTWPWLFLLMFVMGSAAGILNVYRLFNPRTRRQG